MKTFYQFLNENSESFKDVLERHGYIKDEKKSGKDHWSDHYEKTTNGISSKNVDAVSAVPDSKGKYDSMTSQSVQRIPVTHKVTLKKDGRSADYHYPGKKTSKGFNDGRSLDKHLTKIHQ